MYESEKLLNVMEQILGPEIAANPVWNIRPKTPGVTETDNPWHQGIYQVQGFLKVRNTTRIRNLYNQVPHLSQDTKMGK